MAASPAGAPAHPTRAHQHPLFDQPHHREEGVSWNAWQVRLNRRVIRPSPRGCRTTGPRGWRGLYAAYADRLYTYAITQTRDRDAAADAVADTFLLARDRIGQLRDPDKLRPWLYAICRNECLRHHRRSSRVADLEAAGPMKDTTIDLDRGWPPTMPRRWSIKCCRG